MRVLISVVSFRYLTGAELYVYELSRCLRVRGHDVTVASGRIGGEITQRATRNGVHVIAFDEADPAVAYDVLHVQERVPTTWALAAYPDIPAVATVHSQWPCEDPAVDGRIHKYVCIRPEIRTKIVQEDGIDVGRTAVVYNGVDFARFNREGIEPRKRDLVLFAGTVDPLRREAALHLIKRSVRERFDVLFVGTRHGDHLDGPLPPNVRWLEGDAWEIEKAVKACTATAGIVLGRTTIEGWACGKPGWIYDIDLEGRIRSVELFPPPHKDLLQQFDIEFMTDQMEVLYREAIAAGATATAPFVASTPPTLDVDPDRFNVLALAEEVVADPELLRRFAAEHGEDPDATLVLLARGDDEAAWVQRLTAALTAAGPEAENLDLLLVVTAPDAPVQDAAAQCDGVLTGAGVGG